MGFGNGEWDSGTGIWERGKIKRAKIERKARRVAERPKERLKAKDKGLRAEG